MATNNGYDPNQPRDTDGKWTDGGSGQKKGYDSRKDTTVKRAKDKIDSISKNSYGLKSTTPHAFTDKLQEAKETIRLEDRWRVDLHDVDDYKNDKLFSTDFGSCVAIEPSGNIISVCKKEGDKTRGSQLLEYAIKNGETALMHLVKSYISFIHEMGLSLFRGLNSTKSTLQMNGKKLKDSDSA